MSFIIYDIIGLIGLVVIGLVLIAVSRLLVILIPAALVAFIVWFLTRNTWWTGVAFLIVAALSIVKKLRQ
jgi:membrane protein implicated in regulation of membrane protease activity